MKRVIEVRHLVKHYTRRSFFVKEKPIRALDDVNFDIANREVFGVVGESGSGKTTLGLTTIRFIEPTQGKIFVDGVDYTSLKGKEFERFRKRFSVVFQNPSHALDPNWSVSRIVSEPLESVTQKEKEQMVFDALNEVGLPKSFAERRPHELSGGQKQRVAIARALINKPQFVVLDEPTSALDVSIQAQILNLLVDLQEKHNLTYMLISHDLNVVGKLSDRVAVMYLGKIVEIGDTIELFRSPLHPYTQALLSSLPGKKQFLEFSLVGDVPSAKDPPSGCRFHTRCPYATEICKREEPKMLAFGDTHSVACHNTHLVKQKAVQHPERIGGFERA